MRTTEKKKKEHAQLFILAMVFQHGVLSETSAGHLWALGHVLTCRYAALRSLVRFTLLAEV